MNIFFHYMSNNQFFYFIIILQWPQLIQAGRRKTLICYLVIAYKNEKKKLLNKARLMTSANFRTHIMQFWLCKFILRPIDNIKMKLAKCWVMRKTLLILMEQKYFVKRFYLLIFKFGCGFLITLDFKQYKFLSPHKS